MKKIMGFLLLISMAVALSACSSKTTEAIQESLNETELAESDSKAEAEELTTYSLGDSVETDILGITLNKAQLAIKVNSTSTASYDSETNQYYNVKLTDDYFLPDEYDEATDVGAAYVAAKGHTYVVIEFKATNLDRASVEFDGAFNETFMTVEYAGETYIEETTYGCCSEDGINWEKYTSSNVLLLAGESEYMRCFIDIPTDAESLDDTFVLTFTLPNSNGTSTDFSFAVSSEDREIVESQEISTEEAIARFTKTESIEYFSQHMDEFTVLTGDEIKQVVTSKIRWIVDIKYENGTSWSGKYRFEEDGKIEETIYDGSTGYFNDCTWAVEGDTIILNGGESCEVRNVADDVYLFVKDGTPYLLMQDSD